MDEAQPVSKLLQLEQARLEGDNPVGKAVVPLAAHQQCCLHIVHRQSLHDFTHDVEWYVHPLGWRQLARRVGGTVGVELPDEVFHIRLWW